MGKILYLIRHCRAAGQSADAPLTPEGAVQAEALADSLAEAGIGRIVSSPFVRAVASAGPLAARLNLEIELDERLVEAALSGADHADWPDKLRATFADFDLGFEGGETSRAASARAAAAVRDALSAAAGTVALVTHGRLMTLILKQFDPRFGFDEWRALATPDVFRVAREDDGARAERISIGAE